jgi:putative ABC transport system permease protein
MQALRALFRKARLDEELDREIQFHIEQQVEENIAAGMSPSEARRAALVAFGGREKIKEECREARGFSWLEGVLQDLRFGLRTLRKDRGYTFAAIVALGLGIGANTALFSLFDSVALRPLPVPDPEGVVEIYRTSPQIPYGPFSYADYLFYRDHNTVFTGVAATLAAHLRMSGVSPQAAAQSGSPASVIGFSGPEQIQGAAEPVIALFVSGNYFSVMGARTVLGRSILPEDDQPTGTFYPALISESFWERRFGRDANILGRGLVVSGMHVTVVGVTPRDFMGTRPQVPDVWLPLAAQPDLQRRAQDRSVMSCMLEARMKPGVTIEQAQAETDVLSAALRREYPDGDPHAGASVKPAEPSGWVSHRSFEFLYFAFQAAMLLVLLIACANVAGLLLGRATSRRREIAIRQAVGASRLRLVRQLLTESALIALLAGGISVALTWWLLDFLVRFVSASLAGSGLSDGGTLLLDVTPNARVMLYSLGVALLSAVAFALAPALQATRLNLTPALKDEAGAFGAGEKSRFRGWTVVTQIAVCLTLLIGAGVLVRSSVRLLSVDPGFQTGTVFSVAVTDPGELGYSAGRAEELRRSLQERLPALPGVKSTAVASRVPLGGNVTSTTVVPRGGEAAGDARPDDQAAQYPFTLVSPEYFETLGIPLLRGRTFTRQEAENRAPVVVVSDALARRLWPGRDPVGQHVTVGSPTQTRFLWQQAPYLESSEVVGVARDVYSVSTVAPDTGAIYLPQPAAQWNAHMLVRTEGDPRGVAAAVTGEVRAVDPNLSVSLQRLDALMTSDGYFVFSRLSGIVFSIIGLLGLMLASVGIYSMVGYSVSRQTREIGIRVALGAQRTDVLRLVLGRSVRPILVGVAAGLALGTALSLVLSSVLPGLKLLDPAVLLAVSTSLTAIALVAAYIPARRAMSLDPVAVLRFE